MPVGGRRSRSRDEGERGAALVLFAVVLVVLMIFSAFAVDIGTAYAQRRQNRSSVDTAALAGGQRMLMSGSFPATIAAIKAVANANLTTPLTKAQWDACVDAGALTLSSVTIDPTNGSPCISFSQPSKNGSMSIRVHLPEIERSTSFAGVIGINKLSTTGTAVVRVGTTAGGTLPVYIFSGIGAGAQVCVLNAPGGQSTPCSGAYSGQFGAFDPYYYQAPGCPSGNAGAGQFYDLGPAFAKGLDHFLAPGADSSHPYVGMSPPDRINGGNTCTVLAPNTLSGTTGFSNQTISKSLIGDNITDGVNSYNGRLIGGPYSVDSTNLNPATINHLRIDNRPLWSFLLPASQMSSSAPLECKVASSLSAKRDILATKAAEVAAGVPVGQPGGPTDYTPEALMTVCLTDWNAGDGVIFSEDVANSPRMGSVPRYWETSGGPASSYYHIRDFVPIFLFGEFQKLPGQNFSASPERLHFAGDIVALPSEGGNNTVYKAWNPNGNATPTMQGVKGTFVPCGSLPSSVCTIVAPNPSDNELGGSMNFVVLTQ